MNQASSETQFSRQRSGRGAARLRAGGLTLAIALIGWLAPTFAEAGDVIHSNGRGGGPWTESATWHGGEVPEAEDTVVIAMRDRVVFDGHDPDQASCAELHIDPEGTLTFAEGRGTHTLTVNGPITSYGTIRLDATESRHAQYRLRLTSKDAGRRTIELREHAALMSYGHEQGAGGQPSVALVAEPLSADSPDNAENEQKKNAKQTQGEADNAGSYTARVTANGKVRFDLQRTLVKNVAFDLKRLDNSGATASERLNVLQSRFEGSASLTLTHCDSPAIRGNVFTSDAGSAPTRAIDLNHVALGSVRDTRVVGPWKTAIRLNRNTDSTVAGTTVEGADIGVQAIRGHGTSLRELELRNCSTGLWLSRVHQREQHPVVEDVLIERAERGVHVRYTHGGQVQFSDCRFVNPVVEKSEEGENPPPPVHFDLVGAAVRLINTDVASDEIRHRKDARVETMYYLVVGAVSKQGELPAGAQVRVRTAERSGGVPDGKADLNVRHSPAALNKAGLTPLPASDKMVTVRGWRLDKNGNRRQAPFYELRLEAPKDGSDGYKTLSTREVEPGPRWFRPDPDDATPTVEIQLP